MLSLSSVLSAHSTRFALGGVACLALTQAALFADEQCPATLCEAQAKTVAQLFDQAISDQCAQKPAKNVAVWSKKKMKKAAKATPQGDYAASDGSYGKDAKDKNKRATIAKKKKKEQATPATKLAWMIEENPATWDVVAQLAKEHFSCSSATPAKRSRIVDLISTQNVNGAHALGLEFWKADAASFSHSDLIAFAENGSEQFARELKKMVKAGTDKESCLPAAYFALRGYDHGTRRLVQAVQQELQPETIHHTLLAAKALAKLGQKKHWASVQDRLFEQVIAALKVDDLDRARAFTLGAVCMRKAFERGSAMKLSYLNEEAEWYGNAKSDDLATADQILEVIEELAPVM